MAKIKNNPIMKGISGMLGDVVVYRETRGRMIMSNRPKTRDELTEHQKSVKSRFLQAVQYAKGQMADPATKAAYAAIVSDRFPSAYAAAVADYLKGPEILSLDVSGYSGQAGDVIDVIAIDNFKVTRVSVEIRSASDVVIESGDATALEGNTLQWRYNAQQNNAQVNGSRVIVRATDKPGNATVKQFLLPIVAG